MHQVDREKAYQSDDLATALQHAGASFRQGHGLIGAIEQSVTFATPDTDAPPVYSRLSNTNNHREVEALLKALHGARDAIVFGSGMAALSTCAFALLKPGEHVLVQENCYGGNWLFYTKTLAKWGVDVSFAAVEEWPKLLRPGQTRLCHVESISNPFCVPQDIAAAVRLAHGAGALLLCDNTFASPVNCQPLQLGADIVLESATKYLNGHSDVTAGALCFAGDHADTVRDHAKNIGGFLPASAAMQLARGIRTLALRMAQHNINGQAFAAAMRQEAYVMNVYYGGHHSTFNGFGGMLALRFQADVDVAKTLRKLRLIKDVPSLGGTESSVTMPTFTTNRYADAPVKQALGIDASLVRISVGLESVSALVDDVRQAVVRI